MATLLSVERLEGIRIPTEQEEHQRFLTRTRQQLIEDRTAAKNKIRMKCHQMGLIHPEDKREMSYKLVTEMLAKAPSKEFALVVQAYLNVWKSIDAQIKTIEQQLKQKAEEDPKEKIYRSVPGVGALSARILADELGDLSQFKNERQLFSYTGLTPSEHSSGDKIRKGHITHQGNRRVRRVLNQVAWRAIKKDQDLQELFERLYPKTGKKKAIVAVSRKLIGRIRAALRKNQPYQINFLTHKAS